MLSNVGIPVTRIKQKERDELILGRKIGSTVLHKSLGRKPELKAPSEIVSLPQN